MTLTLTRKFYQDNGKISMTYEDSVAKLSRTSFSPQQKWISSPHNYNSDCSTAPSNHKTQYQLSYYNSRPKLPQGDYSPQRYGTNDPCYSAHKTAAKFFRTIEHSPILGAKDLRSKSFLRALSPIKVFFERAPSNVQLRI